MAQSDDGWDTVYFGDEEDATNLNVAEVVERYQVPLPLELPEEERTGDGDNLIHPFPKADMGLDRSEYSGELSTASEESDANHPDFYTDSKGLLPEDVFARASVPLEEVAKEQAADAERKKQARVAEGRPEDDSAGDESSEEQSSERSSQRSEDESSSQRSEDESNEDKSSSEDESSHEGAAKRPRTDGN